MPDFETPFDRFWQSTLCCCECPALGPWQKFAPEARGNPQYGLVILGEAPGRVSLEQGRPFSNPRNLTVRNAVARAIAPWKIDPERFMYFTDAVKCWPSTASGANRSPSARENANCIKLHLHRELKIIQPRAIFAFGLRATSALLGGPVKLTDHHATIHEHPGGYRVIPLMHPSSINIAGMYRVGLRSQADYETQLAEIFRTEIGRLEIDFARLIYDWESGLEAQ
jgi:uracil-DNA glycosylase family 4